MVDEQNLANNRVSGEKTEQSMKAITSAFQRGAVVGIQGYPGRT